MSVLTLPSWPADVAVHPAAELFPLMGGREFAELVADIREAGLVEPIVRTPDGQILDGRNRYRACLEAGVDPSYRTFAGEPWRFVISTNLHRRHLTDGQRAMIAAKIAERTVGRPTEIAASAAISPPPPSRAEVSELLNVSVGSLERAKRVQRTGTESLRAAVEAGQVPVTTASRVASLPREEQEEFVSQVAAGVNPRHAAPPERQKPQAPLSPVSSRSYYKADRRVLARHAVAQIVQMAGGVTTGLAGTEALDDAITNEEAARWMGDLSEGIRSLRRLHNLLKERSS